MNTFRNSALVGKVSSADVATIIKVGLELTPTSGVVPWPAIQERLTDTAAEVGYSRGWLIVRQAWLQTNQPNLLVDLKVAETEAREACESAVKAIESDIVKAKKANDDEAIARLESAKEYAAFNLERHVIGRQAQVLRMGAEPCSWGEIAVRLNLPESKVRKCFSLVSDRKDLGLRIGKGGRFAYDSAELYAENRRAEGAAIDIDLKRKPAVEELLNYKPKDEVVAKPKAERKPRAAKAPAAKAG